MLFWLEGRLAEVWQATLLSFLSHSTAARKKYVPGDVFSVSVQPGAQHVGIVCELAPADSGVARGGTGAILLVNVFFSPINLRCYVILVCK